MHHPAASHKAHAHIHHPRSTILSSLRVSALPHRLNVLRLSTEEWKPLLSDFLSILLYSNFHDQFVSLTENESQLSVVMDERSAHALQQATESSHQISTGKAWRAIQIYEGADALNATGIVASIAEPLARDGFSVLYISMYNSDLILVEEDQLAPALASVEQALQKIKDLNNPASLLPDLAKLVATSPAPAPSLLSAHTAPKIGAAAAVKKAPVPLTSVEFSVVSAKLQLGWLRKADVKRTCYSLMRLFLRPSSPERFFSFTLAADEVSIVLAEEDFTEIKSEETHIAWHPESWCAMEASVRNPKITPTQLVSSVSSTLADHGFSLFYVGSFSSDFTLVLHRDVDRAIDVLNEHLNT